MGLWRLLQFGIRLESDGGMIGEKDWDESLME
jgi:hypothetical protein